MIKSKGNYTILIGIVIIGDPNYIGTSLSGLTREVNCKKKPYSNYSKKSYIEQNDRTVYWFGHSPLK